MEATKPSTEQVIRDIRRVTRKQYGAEENIRRDNLQPYIRSQRIRFKATVLPLKGVRYVN